MGRPHDIVQRVTLARVDDVSRRTRVAAAREIIYEKGKKNCAVNGAAVENLLKKDSLVPTAVYVTPSLSVIPAHGPFLNQNAFSCKLTQFGFNLFRMVTVDLMHEFELGVWKAIFIHLLRILDCYDECLKHELDRR
jgi:hypothetical protein